MAKSMQIFSMQTTELFKETYFEEKLYVQQ